MYISQSVVDWDSPLDEHPAADHSIWVFCDAKAAGQLYASLWVFIYQQSKLSLFPKVVFAPGLSVSFCIHIPAGVPHKKNKSTEHGRWCRYFMASETPSLGFDAVSWLWFAEGVPGKFGSANWQTFDLLLPHKYCITSKLDDHLSTARIRSVPISIRRGIRWHRPMCVHEWFHRHSTQQFHWWAIGSKDARFMDTSTSTVFLMLSHESALFNCDYWLYSSIDICDYLYSSLKFPWLWNRWLGALAGQAGNLGTYCSIDRLPRVRVRFVSNPLSGVFCSIM